MRVTAIEIPARFGRVQENLAFVDDQLTRGPTDLALLPEASLTGYVSPSGDFDLTRFAEPKEGPTARALAALAKKHGTCLVGPLIEKDSDGTLFNAMIGFDPRGEELLHYRKRHPWYPETWATAGQNPHPVAVVDGFRVTIAICFDIHFAKELAPVDLLLFPSAWVDDPPSIRPEDSRFGLLSALGVRVVNANWGEGEPPVAGQGNSCILHASGKLLARGGPRVDAVIERS